MPSVFLKKKKRYMLINSVLISLVKHGKVIDRFKRASDRTHILSPAILRCLICFVKAMILNACRKRYQ